jgi:hypothetical protein
MGHGSEKETAQRGIAMGPQAPPPAATTTLKYKQINNNFPIHYSEAGIKYTYVGRFICE